MSAEGLRLIGALMAEADGIKALASLTVQKDEFLPSELEIYQTLLDFSVKHGKLPSMEALEYKHPDLVLPPSPDPPSYYAEQVRTRFKYRSITGAIQECAEYLSAKAVSFDPDKALDILQAMVVDLLFRGHQGQLVDFRDAYEIVFDEYKKVMTGDSTEAFYTGWPTLDEKTLGLRYDDILSIVGRPACASGATKMYISRKSRGSGRWYTLAQLFRGMQGKPINAFGKGSGKRWDLSIPTYTQCLKGETTGLNRIEQVLECGVKETWILKTASGKEIRATLDHMFLTEGGVWKQMRDLRQGDLLVVKAPNQEKGDKYKAPYAKKIYGYFHGTPYTTIVVGGRKYVQVREHRAVFDAALNGLPLQVFLERLRIGPNHGLMFSPPGMHIHHRDGNYSNNDPSNLELLSNSEHGKKHAKIENMNRRFGRNEVTLDSVKSITFYGEEMTYDVVMADPYNNFVANDFVTHNSGKTYLGLKLAYHAWSKCSKAPLFVSMEMSCAPLIQRLSAIHTSFNITKLKKGEFSTKKKKALFGSLQQLQAKSHPMWIVDGAMAATVEDIWSLCQQLKPDCLVIDGAYLMGHVNKKLGKWDRIGATAEGVKQTLAKDLQIPIVVSYQFGKQVGKEQKKAKSTDDVSQGGMEDVYGTDVIAQLSSIMLGLIQQPTIESTKKKDVSILKGREGGSGQFTIAWDFDHMNFNEIQEHEDQSDLMYA